jgi:hypothetical protein
MRRQLQAPVAWLCCAHAVRSNCEPTQRAPCALGLPRPSFQPGSFPGSQLFVRNRRWGSSRAPAHPNFAARGPRWGGRCGPLQPRGRRWGGVALLTPSRLMAWPATVPVTAPGRPGNCCIAMCVYWHATHRRAASATRKLEPATLKRGQMVVVRARKAASRLTVPIRFGEVRLGVTCCFRSLVRKLKNAFLA